MGYEHSPFIRSMLRVALLAAMILALAYLVYELSHVSSLFT